MSVWLIERGQSMGHVPTVWFTGDDWTTDANRAVRYSSKDAAEAEIEKRNGFPIPSHGGPFGVATEHSFLAALPGDRAAQVAGIAAAIRTSRLPSGSLDAGDRYWATLSDDEIAADFYDAGLRAPSLEGARHPDAEYGPAATAALHANLDREHCFIRNCRLPQHAEGARHPEAGETGHPCPIDGQIGHTVSGNCGHSWVLAASPGARHDSLDVSQLADALPGDERDLTHPKSGVTLRGVVFLGTKHHMAETTLANLDYLAPGARYDVPGAPAPSHDEER